MMMLGYISGGLTVLIVLCALLYKIGYDTGYKQATIDVRKWVKKEEAHPWSV